MVHVVLSIPWTSCGRKGEAIWGPLLEKEASEMEFRAWNALRRLVGVLVSFASCISIEAYINHPGCILWPSPVVGGREVHAQCRSHQRVNNQRGGVAFYPYLWSKARCYRRCVTFVEESQPFVIICLYNSVGRLSGSIMGFVFNWIWDWREFVILWSNTQGIFEIVVRPILIKISSITDIIKISWKRKWDGIKWNIINREYNKITN